MIENDYLTEQQLAHAKRYIEINSWNLPEFEGVYITSNGESKFTYKRVGTFFTKITVTYDVYKQNKTRFKHLAPNAVAITNSQLKSYAEAHEQHIRHNMQQHDIDEITSLLRQNPTQIEPTLQFVRNNLLRTQTMQRGTSDSSITPSPTPRTKRH